MPRPEKIGLDYFPKWKPQIATERKFGRADFRVRYTALRNSSSAFIKREDVRRYIFSKYGHRCYLCGSTNNLQIDHIVSVYAAAKDSRLINVLNTENNLRPICATCNSSKRP